MDPILRGLVGRAAKLNTQSNMMTDELREKLFKFSANLALDLASLNMQRGRDHGIPGIYSYIRVLDVYNEFCLNYSDLTFNLPVDVQQSYVESLLKSPNLYLGLLIGIIKGKVVIL